MSSPSSYTVYLSTPPNFLKIKTKALLTMLFIKAFFVTIQAQKNLGVKNVWVKDIFWIKKIMGQKKIWVNIILVI